jgi:hypothetical protein
LQAQLRFQQQPQQQPNAEEDFWSAPESFIERRLKNQEANFSFRLATISTVMISSEPTLACWRLPSVAILRLCAG